MKMGLCAHTGRRQVSLLTLTLCARPAHRTHEMRKGVAAGAYVFYQAARGCALFCRTGGPPGDDRLEFDPDKSISEDAN